MKIERSNSLVEYTVIPSNPAAHLFTVRLRIGNPNPEGQTLSLPTWIPGSYMIREFAKNIVEIRAYSDQKKLQITQLKKDYWQVEAHLGEMTVEYEVYAWDLSVRMAHLDQNHGYFNGTSMFLQVHGKENEIQNVILDAPEDVYCQNWRVATSLERVNGDLYTFGSYRATCYDELLDHPVEMGTFELLKFEARGVQHEIALTGKYRFDREKLIMDVQKICENELDFLGRPADLQRFVFQVMVVDSGHGGLEHRSSTSLLCGRDALPKNASDRSDAYFDFLGLCAHEYFHLWNVKRLKPKVFLPYDLSQEAYTTLLWVVEGWTSYYDDLFLVRGGLIEQKEYLHILGENITRTYRGSGIDKQSLSDSSKTAWTKFYRQDENSHNAIVSYYRKGALAAMALDLHLRLETDGKTTLDTIMKELWKRYHQTGMEEDAVEKLAQELSGLDLRAFFDQLVRGTGELPLRELLAQFGISLHRRKPDSLKDLGGKKGSGKSTPSMDIMIGSASDGVKIRVVHDGGAAQIAGLSAGDVIIAIDGIKVNNQNLEDRLSRYEVGDELQVHAFRRDELFERKVTLRDDRDFVHYLEFMDDCSEDIQARRIAWLGK